MPNWCSNTLIVTGEASDVARFKQAVEVRSEDVSEVQSVLSLQKLYPLPDGQGWYEWCNQHWGTKWDVVEAELTRGEATQLIYTFETAWSPPVPWLVRVSKQYPSVRY